ncbi:transcriptional regulator [Dinoroseobacter shibae DFL 12 = DSM 16493]|jgi:TetR/AcrR family transcriptional regulator|uniref:Transcriptional regulator n=1 Tax=Dinoroseobacter shibae (strain DSM 16493 / NCIMB 14021 / DFL 12) TaxID=398580 RepID=A8LIZ3_DINSH|nr:MULTISPECIES: TetR family transcriptional regulator C-terminal domain-containing protein [Dinoroseobacter]ABV93107.1 transcriptional regulator [Dinoroseobacter shibae DFL 12 = DSM 16493]MDD9716209.1 TetR family transcriptional regulator C-terminal domain-containing protein [Dinoroseobacter sp. PD6]URF48036.1 TetR family transcriptional regulator C-terminal domain-containing protein [Dinoroseobacter shibae]URF52345.1 TetR family transcriptional regulator C-terminal domain-containing protein [
MARSSTSARPAPQTRIQKAKREAIFDAALDVFSQHGFRGATLDMIAAGAGLSKPNVLYYFEGKEAIYTQVLAQILETWLDPMLNMDPAGEPLEEIRGYVRRKLEMAREYPRESRLFATEILQGAPQIKSLLSGALRDLVEKNGQVIAGWAAEGKIADVHPKHLIFMIWATTQHYADFRTQIDLVLGTGEDPFPDAQHFLDHMFTRMLNPDT